MSTDWRERFTVSISYFMPCAKKYWNHKDGDPWPTTREGRVLSFNTFEEAVAEKRWRLNNFDKWVPEGATMPDVSEIQRTVYSLSGAPLPVAPPPGRNQAIDAPRRFTPQLVRGEA